MTRVTLMSESSPQHAFPPMQRTLSRSPTFCHHNLARSTPGAFRFSDHLTRHKFSMVKGSTKLCSEPRPIFGAGAESGVDFEPIEGDHTNGAPEVVMIIYGRWTYVKHNEQNINMCDKAINDVRDANNGMTRIMRRRQLYNKKEMKKKSTGCERGRGPYHEPTMILRTILPLSSLPRDRRLKAFAVSSSGIRCEISFSMFSSFPEVSNSIAAG